mgnify:CR=1 FL=1
MVINSIKIKSFIVITFFVVFFLIKPADEYRINKKDKIIGLWKNKNINIQLKSDKKVNIEILKKDGSLENKISGLYSIDLSKQPITIDFKSLNRVPESLYAVIKINKKSELIMSKFSTSWKQRSISFKDSDIIKFKKGN